MDIKIDWDLRMTHDELFTIAKATWVLSGQVRAVELWWQVQFYLFKIQLRWHALIGPNKRNLRWPHAMTIILGAFNTLFLAYLYGHLGRYFLRKNPGEPCLSLDLGELFITLMAASLEDLTSMVTQPRLWGQYRMFSRKRLFKQSSIGWLYRPNVLPQRDSQFYHVIRKGGLQYKLGLQGIGLFRMWKIMEVRQYMQPTPLQKLLFSFCDIYVLNYSENIELLIYVHWCKSGGSITIFCNRFLFGTFTRTYEWYSIHWTSALTHGNLF